MKFSQLNRRFEQTAVPLWNPVAKVWEGSQNICLQVSDRFISDRSFGQRKRNVFSGEKLRQDVFKIDDQVYCVESNEFDMEGSRKLGWIIMVHEMPWVCTFKKLVSAKRANGDPLPAVPTDIVTTWCDIDRYAVEESQQVVGDSVTFNVTFPRYVLADVSEDCYLTVNGIDYDIDQVAHNLDCGWARAVRRGPNV